MELLAPIDHWNLGSVLTLLVDLIPSTMYAFQRLLKLVGYSKQASSHFMNDIQSQAGLGKHNSGRNHGFYYSISLMSSGLQANSLR